MTKDSLARISDIFPLFRMRQVSGEDDHGDDTQDLSRWQGISGSAASTGSVP